MKDEDVQANDQRQCDSDNSTALGKPTDKPVESHDRDRHCQRECEEGDENAHHSITLEREPPPKGIEGGGITDVMRRPEGRCVHRRSLVL